MTTLEARFDGRVLVPEHPVDLPVDTVLEIQITQTGAATSPENGVAQNDVSSDADVADRPPLAGLLEILAELPSDPDTPTDLAAQHDHYLHGMPKRP